MNMHEADVHTKLRRFLERRSMPKALEGKPNAIGDELDALVRAVARHAPHHPNLDDWWGGFEERLAEGNTTRSWPTEGEVKIAAKGGVVVALTTRAPNTADLDFVLRLNTGRIERGEVVGEDWFYGNGAARLVSAGTVKLAQLRPYRSGLYFAEKEFYGEEKARANEQTRQRQFDDALAAVNAPRVRHQGTAAPDKRGDKSEG